MAKVNNLAAGISEPEAVDAWMAAQQHPMKPFAEQVRQFVLGLDKKIGEGIYWNAPTFYFTGPMQPFDPKTYQRYLVGFNLYRQDTLRLIFLRGANADDPSGILEGDYKDGRRLVSLKGPEELKAKEAALKKIMRQLISQMK